MQEGLDVGVEGGYGGRGRTDGQGELLPVERAPIPVAEVRDERALARRHVPVPSEFHNVHLHRHRERCEVVQGRR